MIIDISNEVYTNLKASLVGVTVLTSYPSTSPVFPCVVFEELSNVSNQTTVDSKGENYNDMAFEINIFSNSNNRLTEVKTIRKSIDEILADGYKMNRSFSGATPNYMDTDTQRYTLRYDFTIDKNKTIYRR